MVVGLCMCVCVCVRVRVCVFDFVSAWRFLCETPILMQTESEEIYRKGSKNTDRVMQRERERDGERGGARERESEREGEGEEEMFSSLLNVHGVWIDLRV